MRAAYIAPELLPLPSLGACPDGGIQADHIRRYSLAVQFAIILFRIWNPGYEKSPT